MDAARLEAFVTVLELGSFTKAAARLRLSQPSVTIRVQSLEAEVGAPLLDRLYGSVRPTSAGQALLPLARDILRLTRLAQTVAWDNDSSPRRRITIGAADCLISFRFLPVLEHVCVRSPELEVELRVAGTEESLAELREGVLDCAIFIDLDRNLAGLERQVLCPEFLKIIAPPGHRLASRAEITSADLWQSTWVRCNDAVSYHQEFLLGLEGAAESPPRTFVLGSLDAAKRAISSGVGISLMPAIAVRDELANGSLVELPWPPQFDISTQIAWRRGDSGTHVMRTLIDDVVRIVGEGAVDAAVV